MGSSPLTRGKPIDVAGLQTGIRLIPAHAGKTLHSGALIEETRAHPRSRGENAGLHVVGELGQGSSPLTRGKRVLLPDQLRERGLIPAHAGKTRRTAQKRRHKPAHPRSRGENP